MMHMKYVKDKKKKKEEKTTEQALRLESNPSHEAPKQRA